MSSQVVIVHVATLLVTRWQLKIDEGCVEGQVLSLQQRWMVKEDWSDWKLLGPPLPWPLEDRWDCNKIEDEIQQSCPISTANFHRQKMTAAGLARAADFVMRSLAVAATKIAAAAVVEGEETG